MSTIVGFQNLDSYNKSLSAAFAVGLPLANVPYQGFTMETRSTAASTSYAGLFEIPVVREWTGDRQAKELEGHHFEITNRTWESTLRLERKDVEDDEEAAISLLAGKVTAMAREANNDQPGRLAFQLLRNGKSGKSYDGKSFFATDHASGANLVTGGSAPWYLVCTRAPVKPIIMQWRVRPELRTPRMDDESVFWKDQVHYGTRARYNAGYGLHQAALRHEGDLTENTFQAALELMGNQTIDGVRYLGFEPDLLIVPWSLRTKAAKLLAATINASGESNVNANAMRYIVTPYVKE